MDDFDWKTFLLSFEGRVSLSDYWLRFAVPEIVISGFLDILDDLTDSAVYGIGLFGFLFLLASLWPATAVAVKRCHDHGRPGAYLWVGLLPIVGAILLFVNLGCRRGSAGPNRYGADPLGARDRATPATRPSW